MDRFARYFSDLPDPRAANVRHTLLEVLFIALAATICGSKSCEEMAEFGRAKEQLLREVLRLEHGVPSHDTFSRVFRLLDPEAFERLFQRFTASLGRHLGGVVAIDGKAVRGAFTRGKRSSPLHLVNVWAVEAGLALAQTVAPGRNEAAGALNVLKLLCLEDCIVTADALHCRRDTATAILDRGGDYALALKDNQPGLLEAAERRLRNPTAASRARTVESSSHGRREHRSAIVVHDAALADQLGFPGLASVARIKRVRQLPDQPPEESVRYFLLSAPLAAERVLEVVRDHWTVENQLHWTLDVVFNEDAARNRCGHGPRNLAVIRKIALNALRSHPAKASLNIKTRRAGWDNAFLLSVFHHMQ